jgi:hypothetical protein
MELLRERERERESSCVHVCDVVGRGGSIRTQAAVDSKQVGGGRRRRQEASNDLSTLHQVWFVFHLGKKMKKKAVSKNLHVRWHWHLK